MVLLFMALTLKSVFRTSAAHAKAASYLLLYRSSIAYYILCLFLDDFDITF